MKFLLCLICALVFFFFFFVLKQPLRYVFRFFLSSVAGFFFSPCASVLSRDSDFKIGGSAVFVPKNFSALLSRDIGNIGNCIFFLRSKKKNQTNGAAGEKKFRVQCKNLAFYSRVTHRILFCEAKKEKWRRRQKKIEVQPGWCGQQPSSPWYSRGSTMVFFFFFFFF